MTRDEIRLVAFILLALVIGAVVQHFRTRPSLSAPGALPLRAPATQGWAKPPYVLKDTRSRSVRANDADQ